MYPHRKQVRKRLKTSWAIRMRQKSRLQQLCRQSLVSSGLPNPFSIETNLAITETRVLLRTEEQQQAAAREREEKEGLDTERILLHVVKRAARLWRIVGSLSLRRLLYIHGMSLSISRTRLPLLPPQTPQDELRPCQVGL